jgi:uncharacterized linocin/CFP29 family protein
VNDLRRELAPLSASAWKAVDEEAVRVLELKLAARKLVDFDGPAGTTSASVNLGRVSALPRGPVDGVEGWQRQVQPLVELRTFFELSRAELDDVERGRKDPDLEPLIEAATRMAHAEDNAVFHGYAPGGIQGIDECSPHGALPISEDYEAYPQTVAEATRLLRVSGVAGPYAIALGPRCFSGLMQATAHGGYPVLELVRRVIDGPVVWAPAIDGAIVLSQRGGDFELTIGQDLSIGYHSHSESRVRLYLAETMTFRVLTPEAAVALVYRGAGATRRTASPGRRRAAKRAGGRGRAA